MFKELTIGKRLKYFRERKKLSQEGLAKAIEGYSRNNIAQYENDLGAPPLSFLRQFVKVCNCSYDQIIDGEKMEINVADQNKELLDLIENSKLPRIEKAALTAGVNQLLVLLTDYRNQLLEQKQKMIDFLEDRLKL